MEIKYPRPLFISTPPNYPKVFPPYREPLNFRKPAPPKVFKDVKLISKNKPVTSSDDEPIIGELSMITDGENDGMAGNDIEISLGLQWVQIDLEEIYEIHLIQVWRCYEVSICSRSIRAYKDVVIQTADDELFTNNVHTLFNNDHDLSTEFGLGKDKEYYESHWGRAIKGTGKTARYVRLYSNGNTENEMNHYIEVEVYGRESTVLK